MGTATTGLSCTESAQLGGFFAALLPESVSSISLAGDSGCIVYVSAH